ncbi:PepSY domain-containing protein [Pseudotabrizicola algicola]|uniref:PepSY domain-containing protein n=1 Tax=Pseudotabrizicola algicola TaxID=2709381 RepID=A0A6B3RRV8_9RHOB|nr:PepSY domain-containing protein [Pseudotabrizicola algicola]NEX47876.1 PepSY domain-containing protein [Pseudotabrizicola algicola]
MIRKVGLLVLGLMLAAPMGFALTVEQAVADLQAAGYTRIEVKRGLSQMKLEAFRGGEKLELVLDRATGAVLKREAEAVRPGENTMPGVSIRERNRDFVRVRADGAADDDGAGDDRRGRGSDDGAGDDRRGRGSDDGAGDDRRGRGSDDGAGDDRRGRGSDDGAGDDGGKGRGRGGDD